MNIVSCGPEIIEKCKQCPFLLNSRGSVGYGCAYPNPDECPIYREMKEDKNND